MTNVFRWLVLGLVMGALPATTATAQVRTIGNVSAGGVAQSCSQCCADSNSNLGPLWSCGSCDSNPHYAHYGSKPYPPSCDCGCCTTVVGTLFCDLKHGLHRGFQCVFGCVTPNGICQGTFDTSNYVACGGGCGGGCDSCCGDGGFASDYAPEYGIPTDADVPSALPDSAPSQSMGDPFRDDQPASARTRSILPSARPHQAYRPAPGKRTTVRRTNYRGRSVR